eukprot:TRINITY_DN734_c1_g1_i1.p1 TRINITY_DN734_c1_g1~~TRINITY_DN734_c1_g1_i1.p1  ORF type:complete len:347 (+),score=50.18 TRINITY_DN734_c1_g1_i1:56-1042(+)
MSTTLFIKNKATKETRCVEIGGDEKVSELYKETLDWGRVRLSHEGVEWKRGDTTMVKDTGVVCGDEVTAEEGTIIKVHSNDELSQRFEEISEHASRDPEGFTLVIDASTMTLPNGTLILTAAEIPGAVQYLHVLDSQGTVTSLENFLMDAKSLRSVSFGSMDSVTSLGEYFLCGCELLRSVDLTSFSHLTLISHCFLSSCTFLTSVDLSPFSSVRSVGRCFLYNTSLTKIDLSPLSNLAHIGEAFLAENVYLPSCCVSALRSVKTIGHGFLEGCTTVASIDLTPLVGVESIGDDFLYRCDGLVELSLPGEIPAALRCAVPPQLLEESL